MRHLKQCDLVGKESTDLNFIEYHGHFPAPPLMLSVIVGDCLHNLRSSLDHIVYQLVIINGQLPTTANMFPICETPDGFNRQIRRNRLSGVPGHAQTLIEHLQPYNTGQAPGLNNLWCLNHLVNIDKHRSLALTQVFAKDLGIEISDDGHVLHKRSLGNTTAHDKAKIMRTKYELRSLDKVKVQIKSGLFVAFKDLPADDLDICVVLGDLIEFIEKSVIARFEPFFDS